MDATGRKSGAGGRVASGEQERRLAVGTLAQQISQAVGTVTALAVITVLARTLSLPEFGTYGLLVSFATYLVFVQGSVETAAIKAIAEAGDEAGREQAFSIAVFLYFVAGLAAGVLIAVGGLAFLEVFNIPEHLHEDARLSVLALAAVTALGWPLKIFQDVLRGHQLFAASAAAESLAYVSLGSATVVLALVEAPLFVLVAAGASLPLAIGVASAGVALVKGFRYRWRRERVDRGSIRRFLSLSAYLFLAGLSDLVIYSLDRAILAAFRSASTVGLYEGPVRAHNLVRQLNGTFVVPVLPASARYLADGDTMRVRDLFLRGTRYTLAVVVPVTIVLVVLAGPILDVWLGPQFGAAETAMMVLVGYWLFNANTMVAGAMLIAAGHARRLAIYAAAVAAVNLGLSLALTPSLGINGVVLGTTISYVVLFPYFLVLALSTFDVRLRDLAREAWLPAYSTGALLAVGLVLVRATATLDALLPVIGAGLLALLAYWTVLYFTWLRPSERVLVRNVALALLRR